MPLRYYCVSLVRFFISKNKEHCYYFSKRFASGRLLKQLLQKIQYYLKQCYMPIIFQLYKCATQGTMTKVS